VSLAAVRALAEFEFLNATFAGEQLVVHARSISVSFDRLPTTDAVPVVHAAAGLTLRALARRVSELDERVASRHLTTDDLMAGPLRCSALRAPAPSGPSRSSFNRGRLLSVGAVHEVPVVVTLDGVATVAVGRRVILGLSFDHRICEPVGARNISSGSASCSRDSTSRRALGAAPSSPRPDYLCGSERLPTRVAAVQ